MFGLTIWEFIIIFFIVAIIYLAGRLPAIGSGLGRGNFKQAAKESREVPAPPSEADRRGKCPVDTENGRGPEA